MATENQKPEEALEKLALIESANTKEDVQEHLDALEAHGLFTVETPEFIDLQINVRDKIKDLLDTDHVIFNPEIFDDTIKGRLEALRDSLTTLIKSTRDSVTEATDGYTIGEAPEIQDEWNEWNIGEDNPADAGPDEFGKIAHMETDEEYELDEDDFEVVSEENIPQAAFEDAPDLPIEPKITETCFKVTEKYLEGANKQPQLKQIIGNTFADYVQTVYVKKGVNFETGLKIASAELTEYLDKTIYKRTEVLEADTKELKSILDTSRNWTKEKTREETYALNKKKLEWKTEKDNLDDDIKNKNGEIEAVNADIQTLQKESKLSAEQEVDKNAIDIELAAIRVKLQSNKDDQLNAKLEKRIEHLQDRRTEILAEPKETKVNPEQLKVLQVKRNSLRAELKKLYDAKKDIPKEIELIDRKINIIAHGTRDQLRKNRKVAPETMLTYIHAFFLDKGKRFDALEEHEQTLAEKDQATMTEEEKRVYMEDVHVESTEITELALKKTEIDMQSFQISNTKGLRTSGASSKEVFAFLGSKEGPFSGMSEDVLKRIESLKGIKLGNPESASNWVTNLSESFEKTEQKEKLKQTVIGVLSNVQGLLDEKRFRKMGVGPLAARELGQLKKDITHAYHMQLANEAKREMQKGTSTLSAKESMNQVLDEVNDFNLELMEAREKVNVDLPDELKIFLKEYRKDYLRNRFAKFLGDEAKEIGKKGLKKLWEKIKEHPRKSAIGGTLLTASMVLGFAPVASTVFTYGTYRFSKWLGVKTWKMAQKTKMKHMPVN